MKRTHWIIAVAVTAFALSQGAVAQPPPPPGGGQGQGSVRGQGSAQVQVFQGVGGGQRSSGEAQVQVRVQQGTQGMQGPPGGGPGGPGGIGGIVGLFQNPEIVRELGRELGFTPEQGAELREIMWESRDILRPPSISFDSGPLTIQRGAGDGPQTQTFSIRMDSDEVRQRMEEGRQRLEAGIDAVQARIDRVLRPEQRERLRDVNFQLSGGLESPVLGTPMGVRTLAALDLTDAQKEEFRKLVGGRQRVNFEDFNLRDPGARERLRTAVEAENAKFIEQVKGLLTAEQRAKAEKLTAETPELRKRLGMPEPGQRGQQPPGQPGRQPGGPPPPPPGGGYAPGQGAWQPGQGAPQPAPPRQPPRGGGFPRGEN